MAARLPQVARLILFTGPNCSLCDVAKSELAKVRQSYQFDLEIVNIQDKGQERWKKKYIYWIPALHLDGREIAKGRWDASNILESLRQRKAALEAQEEELSPQLYFYDRHVSGILGENQSPSPALLDARFCFNCGSPDHIVGSCSEPHNRPLIALSRQLFNFLRSDSDGETREQGRFHVVEAWKKQRLEWLEFFQPGKIVGPTLREALGLQQGDSGHQCAWLYNMSCWGYPAGWISDTDPRDAVRQRISGDFHTLVDSHSLEDADDSFLIVSDEEDREVIDLSLATSFYPKSGGDETSVVDDTLSSNSDMEPRSSTPRRWAIYPNDYFSSDHLTVYNGMTFISSDVATSRPSSTFTAERRALWEQIISGTQSANALVPPWRLPGALSSLQSHIEYQPPPPPPPSTPPPLPPSPPFPPPPAAHPQYCALVTVAEDDSNSSDIDMDLSDDE